jgi:hypothetical protein
VQRPCPRLEAPAEGGGEPLTPAGVVDLLGWLVDRSLVVADRAVAD